MKTLLRHLFHACSFILWLLIFQALSGVIQFGTISIDYARPMVSVCLAFKFLERTKVIDQFSVQHYEL